MVMLLTIICGFFPALNIVGEKESGTIEQINVTPVGKFQFILAKLIPLWIIGVVIMAVSLGLAKMVYGITPAGSLWTLMLFSGIYILVVSGMGLVVSNYASTIQHDVCELLLHHDILPYGRPFHSGGQYAGMGACHNNR